MSGASWRAGEVIQDGGLMEGQDFVLKKSLFLCFFQFFKKNF